MHLRSLLSGFRGSILLEGICFIDIYIANMIIFKFCVGVRILVGVHFMTGRVNWRETVSDIIVES